MQLTPPPAHIADGIYYYGQFVGDFSGSAAQKLAEWKVTIKNGGRDIVEQTTQNTRMPTGIELTFDPVTFSVTVSHFIEGGPAMRIESNSNGSATVQNTDENRCTGMPQVCSTPHSTVTPLPGTTRIVPLDPFLLPFIIVKSGERAFTIAHGKLLQVAGACTSQPPPNHRRDSCVRISWTDDTPMQEDLWYDPNTLLLDRYSLNGQPPTDRIDT